MLIKIDLLPYICKIKMFNRFIVQTQNDRFRKLKQREDKNRQWLSRYNSEVRPSLLTKYQKRLQGFAKRMQSDPVVILQQPKQQIKTTYPRNFSEKKFIKNQQRCLTQGISSARHKILTKLNFQSLQNLPHQKFIEPIRSFRFRQKKKQINPPMKIGVNNIKLNEQGNTVTSRKKSKNSKTQSQSEDRLRNLSRSSFKSTDRVTQNLDLMSINQFFLQKKFETYKTQKLKKQEQQLKALAGDRLYFKSLLCYQQSVGDKILKKNLKKLLVKCNVTRPTKQIKKQETQKDFFAQMMKQSSNH